jgi:hypothetical protein
MVYFYLNFVVLFHLSLTRFLIYFFFLSIFFLLSTYFSEFNMVLQGISMEIDLMSSLTLLHDYLCSGTIWCYLKLRYIISILLPNYFPRLLWINIYVLINVNTNILDIIFHRFAVNFIFLYVFHLFCFVFFSHVYNKFS